MVEELRARLGGGTRDELSEGLGAKFIEGLVDKLGKRMRSKLSEGDHRVN